MIGFAESAFAGLIIWVAALSAGVASICGVLAATYLFIRNRRKRALAVGVPSAFALAGLAVFFVMLSRPTFSDLSLDMRDRQFARKAPFRCRDVGGTEMCFIEGDLGRLDITLPDGQRREFRAWNPYATYSTSRDFPALGFHLYPSDSELSGLLENETAVQSPRRHVEASRPVQSTQSDQVFVFHQRNYCVQISVTLVPRLFGKRRAVQYEINPCT